MIELTNIQKIYKTGRESVEALKNVSFHIKTGEFVVVVGASGSGKSTLLHLIGALDKPTSGEIRVNGRVLSDLSDKGLSYYRNEEIGFIFQEFHLLQHLNILENVQIPSLFNKTMQIKKKKIKQKAKELLKMLGLEARLSHRPSEISGGQKQRVAIARALINNPKILLADEPTGNLDSITGKKIIQLLRKIQIEQKITTIIVTHDREIAKNADRIIEMKDGVLIKKNHFGQFMS